MFFFVSKILNGPQMNRISWKFHSGSNYKQLSLTEIPETLKVTLCFHLRTECSGNKWIRALAVHKTLAKLCRVHIVHIVNKWKTSDTFWLSFHIFLNANLSDIINILCKKDDNNFCQGLPYVHPHFLASPTNKTLLTSPYSQRGIQASSMQLLPLSCLKAQK